MSEKTDLELQANPNMPKLALEQKHTTPQPPKKKSSLRPRLWKAICVLECHFMASFLHGYAIAHAQKVHLTRWDEVMIPDVENLVDWIKLFVVCPDPAGLIRARKWTFGADRRVCAEHYQRTSLPLDELNCLFLHRCG
jgi:hypothetical protein